MQEPLTTNEEEPVSKPDTDLKGIYEVPLRWRVFEVVSQIIGLAAAIVVLTEFVIRILLPLWT
jgi:hypothetical protein